MADYITKESVHTMIRHLTKFAWRSPTWDERRVTVDTDDVHFGVDKIPSADVAPVVHGRWIHSRYDNCSEQFELVKCSQCNHEAYAMAFYVRGGNYCPNCGAKMDGDVDE